MRPMYLDTDTEEALIEELNEVDAAWRESYDTPLDAAEDLIPRWLAENCGTGDDYAELDFNGD
jgi:hypothetical protein